MGKIIPFIVLNEFREEDEMKHGVANGYVAVGPDNRFYDLTKSDNAVESVIVHGGITLTEPAYTKEFPIKADETTKTKPVFPRKRNPLLEKAVYLTLDRIVPDNYWIFGFDTFHYPNDNKYDQDLDFCIKETLRFAEQFK